MTVYQYRRRRHPGGTPEVMQMTVSSSLQLEGIRSRPYRTGFSEVSPHEVVKAIVNTVLGRGGRTCTNARFWPLRRVPPKLRFFVVCGYYWYIRFGGSEVVYFPTFPARILALVARSDH